MKSEIDIIEAHKHPIYHREEVMQSELCGCFYCLEIFPPSEITEWIDEIEGVNTAALCPLCGIDSVIGSKSGYPITRDFLKAMRQYWF